MCSFVSLQLNCPAPRARPQAAPAEPAVEWTSDLDLKARSPFQPLLRSVLANPRAPRPGSARAPAHPAAPLPRAGARQHRLAEAR